MLYVVGLGPGGDKDLTKEAVDALTSAEVVVGYSTYMRLVREFTAGKETVMTGMKQEVERCQQALEIAETGKIVAIVSSGDAGVYGMAGLIFELAKKGDFKTEIQVIAGVTASLGGAALLGAPLMNDFCHISLSDLMTPWSVIEKRLSAAASADFVICLYNPRSKGRPHNLAKALAIVGESKASTTIVGLAKDVGRKKEMTAVTTIAELDEELVDMRTLVIIGNKETYVHNGRMITPRGYQL